eukprot:gene4472-4898_t
MTNVTRKNHLTVDEIDNLLLKDLDHALELNQRPSDEFVVNNQGHRLHIRIDSPKQPKAFVIYFHGFILHSNRPTEKYFSEYYLSHEIGFVSVDFHGHGYSEGVKGLISHGDELINDMLSVLLALYSSEENSSQYKVKHNLAGYPFFLMGHSMGGGSTLVTSNVLTLGEEAHVLTSYARVHMQIIKERVSPYFRGALLVSPLIYLPSFLKVTASLMHSIWPDLVLPTFFRRDNFIRQCNWLSSRYIKYVETDSYPEAEEGLIYWGGAHMASLQALCELASYAEEAIPQASFPFIVFHDPKDCYVRIEGSRRLFAESPSLDKHLEEVDNGLHDPMTNRIDLISTLTLKWIEEHIPK